MSRMRKLIEQSFEQEIVKESHHHKYTTQLLSPSDFVYAVKQDLFLTMPALFNVETRALREYLHERNETLMKAHNKQREKVKEWVIVLLILADITKDKEESYAFAKTAYEQCNNLPTKYLYGSICRLAIKEYEKQGILVGNIVDDLVHQALEVLSNSKDMVTSLCNCATAFYWIYSKTEQFGSLAEEYCLKASLYSHKHATFLMNIQKKLYDLSNLELFRKVALSNALHGLKDNIKDAYLALLKNFIRQENKPHTNRKEEVLELLKEIKLWEEDNIHGITEVEKFILEETEWKEESFINLILSHDKNLHTLSRLIDEIHVSGTTLPIELRFRLNFLYVKRALAISDLLQIDDPDFYETDITNIAHASNFLAHHYIKKNDMFMAMIILLEFKKVGVDLVNKFLFKNDPVAKANWYFFCIRALEVVSGLYPKHKLFREWQDELDELWIAKGQIDSTIEFNWENEDDKASFIPCTNTITNTIIEK